MAIGGHNAFYVTSYKQTRDCIKDVQIQTHVQTAHELYDLNMN